MMCMRGWVVAVSSILLLASIAACGGSRHEQAATTELADDSNFRLPSPQAALKAVSATVEGAKAEGSDFLADAGLFQHAESLTEATQARLSPEYSYAGQSFDGAAFCIYRLHIPGYHDTATINYDFDASPANWEVVWIGVGNWDRGAWDLFPGEELNHIDLYSIDPYIDASDELLVAVIALGTEELLLDYVQVGDNLSPQAVLTADPTAGETPLTVQLDGSGSYDFGDTLALYEWDAEGDGTFEQSGAELTSISHEYASAATYNATLRVTDNHRATNTATVPVTVTSEPSGTWHLVRADEGNQETGWYPDLEEVAGFPAVAYHDHKNTGTPGEIRYIRATDAQGSAWGAPIILGVCGQYGGHPSLLVVDGMPAVAYADGANSAIQYMRATDAEGAAWGSAVKVADDPWERPGFVSLCLIAGNPAVAYMDSYGDVYFVRASDNLGENWPASSVLLDDNTSAYSYSQGMMLVADGTPLVFYNSTGSQDVRLVRAQDSVGSAWGTPQMVVDNDSYGTYHAEIVVESNPAIAYIDGATVDVYYMRATDALGTTWGAPVKITSLTAVNRRDISLAMISGKPALSFYDQENGKLVYARAQDAMGAAWDPPQVVDNHPGDTTGWYGSLRFIEGQPCIAYYNATQGALQFAALY